MSFSTFILSTVKSLIIYIESEIKIMDEQLSVLGKAPGIAKKDQIQLSLQRNIKSALHDLLVHYYRTMEQTMPAVAPLQQVISCHIYTSARYFQILLHELYGQQSALTTLVGEEYKKCTNDSDLPADIHLQMIFLVFPWEFIIDLLSNSKFLKVLLKTVLNYNPSKHVKAVSTIFNSIQKSQTLPLLASKIRFFTAQAPMYFALAELLVTIFTHNVMMKVNWNPLLNFSIAEKCALIAQHGIEICELNTDLMKALHEGSLKRTKDDQPSDEFLYLRPIESIQQSSSEGEEFDIDNIELPELRHVVLELRKIEYKYSPSSMLFCLSNAIQWLTAALTVDGRQIGADESFQFFAFCLSHAKLSCLPAIVSFIDKFVDDALHETKYEYYIEHLRSGFQFIDNRLLPVQPFLVFPFAHPPPHLKDVLIRVEADDAQKSTRKANDDTNSSKSSDLEINEKSSSLNSTSTTTVTDTNNTNNSPDNSNSAINTNNSNNLTNANTDTKSSNSTIDPHNLISAKSDNADSKPNNSTTSSNNEINPSNSENSAQDTHISISDNSTSGSNTGSTISNSGDSINFDKEVSGNDSNKLTIINEANQNLNSKNHQSQKKKPGEPILMKGFEMYAFPTWTNEYNTLFPAMIRYTGKLGSVICYQYNVSSSAALSSFNETFEAIPTLHGTFFQLKEELIKSAFMIKVESEDYEKEEDNIEVFSSLMLMASKIVSNPKLSMLDQVFTSVKIEWHLRSNDSTVAIKTAVAEVQKALVLLNFLPESFPIDGVFNFDTISAIREFIKNRKLIITPQLFKAIISAAK